jgi:hypothetical protein
MAVRLFPISPDRRHQRRNHWHVRILHPFDARVPHLRAAAYLRLLPVAPVHREQAMTYADVHHPQMSTATSIAGMAQQLSRGFGVSFVAVLLQLSLAWRSESTLGTTDFTVAFTGAAALALLSLGLGWTLRHDGGRSQRPPARIGGGIDREGWYYFLTARHIWIFPP